MKNTISIENAPWVSKGEFQYLVYETDKCNCGKEFNSAYLLRILDGFDARGYIKDICPECEEEERLEATRALEVEECTKNYYSESHLNNKLIEASFDNFFPKSNDQERALNIAKRYATNFQYNNPVGLLFYGNYGTGKSHLAASIARSVLEIPVDTIFIPVPTLLTKIKSTFGNRSYETEASIIHQLSNVTLLIIDDIGSENTTDWVEEKIFEIIDNRIGKHTIYTSNLSPKDLQQKLGGRIFSRLLEDVQPVKMFGEDYRLKHLKK
jgi:DNA replication protein DnaC